MERTSAKPFPTLAGDVARVMEPMVAPINKVGLVLLRDIHHDDPLVCLTQVTAKNPAEQHLVDFGLPKGTRQYLDPADRTWKDARDFLTAHQYRDALEPLSATLMKEAEQEIGVPKAAFAQASIYNLGTRLFNSRKNASPHDIQWYVMQATERMVASMNPSPDEAHAIKWVRLSDVRAMEELGKINSGYVDVIEDAITSMRSQTLRPAQFIEAPLPTK